MRITLPTAIYSIVSNFLSYHPLQLSQVSNTPITFHLRHHHAVSNARNVFSDIHPSSLSFQAPTSFSLPTTTVNVPRPPSFSAFTSARWAEQSLDWHDVEIPGPDVTKRDTLLQLAQMTHNAYFEPGNAEWYDLTPDWNVSYPFGWEPDADGFRGHVFVSSDNATVVISVKGTSAGWIAGGGGPTTKKDKINDNLLFSCCCARVGPTWSTVCDCYERGYKCDQTCLERALIDDSLFYPIGINLYNNITYMYPDANIWLIGHSLGGALASLVGSTFGAPVVAFEAPGERMAARRLHLPSPPSTQHITHVYHTADPIAMGTCNGVTSFCAVGGYAMETRCHLGQVVRYDTVQELQWSVDIRTHTIKVIIERLLSEDGDWISKKRGEKIDSLHSENHYLWRAWNSLFAFITDGGKEEREEVPKARYAAEVEGGEDGECSDCYSWEFGEFRNGTDKKRRGIYQW